MTPEIWLGMAGAGVAVLAVVAVAVLAMTAVNRADRAAAAEAKAERADGSRRVAEQRVLELAADNERLTARGDALEDFARDQLSETGAVSDGVDRLLAELSTATASPRSRGGTESTVAVPRVITEDQPTTPGIVLIDADGSVPTKGSQ